MSASVWSLPARGAPGSPTTGRGRPYRAPARGPGLGVSASWYVPLVLRKALRLIPLLAAVVPFLTTDQSLGAGSVATAGHPAALFAGQHVAEGQSPRAAGSVQVTAPPVGLSIEYPVLAQYLGPGACPAALVAELLRSRVAAAGAGRQQPGPGLVPSGVLTGPPSSWETASCSTRPRVFWSQLHCMPTGAKDPLHGRHQHEERRTLLGHDDGR